MARKTAADVHLELSVHQKESEERWKTIFARLEGIEEKMDRLQFLLLGATGTVILFLGGIILKLVG